MKSGERDHELARVVRERIARLLDDQTPRSGAREELSGRAADVEDDFDLESDDDHLDRSERLPPARRRFGPFGPVHLAVIAVVGIVGLLVAGWAVLRAQPVSLATPVAQGTPAGAGQPSPGGPAPTPTGVATPTADPVTIMVHVIGAVRKPGLVSLPERARVADAIERAGGLTRDADPERLNLAQVLGDGQQIVIGTKAKPAGEVRDGTGGQPGTGGPDPPGSAGGRLDLNTASQSQLEELPGVGPVTADKIIAWRQQHGRFSRVEELQEVDGIGPKTFAELAPHVRV
ncbi:helix-hairpin-helix domain-containing protein [Microlunatus speluncae]|uniref:helix-hairpin-helix domain-containing protein n=1 Tax=Microlunatus speluncae TaxID=2594267 RepID=UPI0013760088|nr:helix-hairpin-helix domain-containing protein [Microlunatus speluncae]